MKTENEIIKETVEYYWADPKRRAATAFGCKYQMLDGRIETLKKETSPK